MTFIHHGACAEPRQNRTFRATRAGRTRAQEVSMYDCYECGPGWYPLIKDALTKIDALGNANLAVLQVKEKFGGLRIYLSIHNDETDAIITAAEQEALKTCEDCGSKEKVELRGGGWLRTLCNHCEERRKKR